MQPHKSWSNDYTVHSYLCNNKGKLRLSSIAMFFQESAWEHAETCGAGYETLKPYGLVWILYGLKIEIHEFPCWNDKLRLETWGKKYENLFAYRDFEIFPGRGEDPIIKATSSWLLVAAETHRPVRITDELKKIPPNERDAIKEKSGAVYSGKEFNRPEMIRPIHYSDLDIYNHVNNTRYIQFCIDASPEIQQNSDRIRFFDIRFVQETRANETLLIKSNQSGNIFTFLGEKQEEEKEVFSARLELQ
jgi:medium-chain acyl-[acyl-carrier-protein] hydrolase